MKTLRNIAIVLITGAGCASAAPPSELAAARTAYDRASRSPAAQFDPTDLHTAKETLGVAEQYFKSDGATQETRDIAYAAERRAEIATARAQALESVHERDATVAQMNAATLNALGRANQQKAMDEQSLAGAQQALAAEKQREADADKRASEATADLARVASVRQDARGLVITLSGSVLFASGKATVLPGAQSRLADVANALTKQDPASKIVVQGYTDSRGSDALNQDLSQHRAESVVAFMTSHGVAADRITAMGFGASNPIADNASPEGRANNRRVEIVVQQAPGTSPPRGG
jgi:outer membrane protein OmpA-like peptidoglycan-associated protein